MLCYLIKKLVLNIKKSTRVSGFFYEYILVFILVWQDQV